MPFETFSNELNRALGGGFGYGMSMIIGGRRSGKTTMAIDLVGRYLRQPGAKNVVVVTPDIDTWVEAIRDHRLNDKVILSRTIQPTRGLNREITIAEVTSQTDGRGTYYVGERPFSLAEVVNPDSATIFLSLEVMGSVRGFNAVVQLSEFNQIYTAKILKNRAGANDVEFNVTRREILEDSANDTSSLDAILGDDFDDI